MSFIVINNPFIFTTINLEHLNINKADDINYTEIVIFIIFF